MKILEGLSEKYVEKSGSIAVKCPASETPEPAWVSFERKMWESEHRLICSMVSGKGDQRDWQSTRQLFPLPFY